MREVRVNIICPCYNDSKYLKQLINSLIKQTYDHIGIIMVDDGSTDSSVTEMERLSIQIQERGYEFRIIKQKNGGLANAYESGLKECNAEYILQIDCDDTIIPSAIERMVDYLDTHPNIAVVRANGIMHYQDEKKADREFLDLPYINRDIQQKEDLCEDILKGTAYLAPPCSYMYRLKALMECYPDRHIDNSRLGQAYQILLPLTYHFNAGFIEDKLFSYTIRNDSLEHISRTAKEELWRIEESSHLIYRVLVGTGAPVEFARKWAVYRRSRLKLTYAYKYHDKKMAEKSYYTLKKYGFVDLNMRVNYLATKYTCLRKLRILIRKLRKNRKDG